MSHSISIKRYSLSLGRVQGFRVSLPGTKTNQVLYYRPPLNPNPLLKLVPLLSSVLSGHHQPPFSLPHLKTWNYFDSAFPLSFSSRIISPGLIFICRFPVFILYSSLPLPPLILPPEFKPSEPKLLVQLLD